MKRRAAGDVEMSDVDAELVNAPRDAAHGHRPGGSSAPAGGVEGLVGTDVVDTPEDPTLEDAGLDQSLPDAARLIAEAVKIARANRAGGADLASLVALYWRLVPDEELIGRSPAKLVEVTLSHRELALRR